MRPVYEIFSRQNFRYASELARHAAIAISEQELLCTVSEYHQNKT